MEAPHLIAAGAVADALGLEEAGIEDYPVAPVAQDRDGPGRAFVADVVQRACGVVAVARGGDRSKPVLQPLMLSPLRIRMGNRMATGYRGGSICYPVGG